VCLIGGCHVTCHVAAQGPLEKNFDWQVCGDAANGLQGVQQACTLQPDLIAIDYSMPLMNGIEASTEIVKLAPDIRTLHNVSF
jgi:DNA-binding NarL/FixJ family response regulator